MPTKAWSWSSTPGEWWFDHTGLPLPLGANGIRKNLGVEAIRDVHRLLRESIAYGLEHREEALSYAMSFGRGLNHAKTDQFVEMYVNQWTLDFGPVGRQAVARLLAEGHKAGVISEARRAGVCGVARTLTTAVHRDGNRYWHLPCSPPTEQEQQSCNQERRGTDYTEGTVRGCGCYHLRWRMTVNPPKIIRLPKPSHFHATTRPANIVQ